MDFLRGVGRLFYIISVNETAIPNLQSLPEPDYVTQAVPYFLGAIVLEYIIQWIRAKPTARLNDGITSLSHGMFLGCGQLMVRGIESYFYLKIWENYRIYELPWDSTLTWYIAALAVDFGYYWLHRAAHELNFFWAQHQVHHSSEEYNLTTALRQSALQGWIGWLFYLPMAFFVPPQIFLIHQQFNLLIQFWIHTEVIESMGPLEYILNTPRHHRIHHGSNRYCLDKNYAGWLIIWDRMFGTFQEEKKGETIIYGLVEEVKSFNPFWLQFFYFPKIRDRMKEMTNTNDKLSVVFKGPGWAPGTTRLGDNNLVPEIPNREKFDIQIPLWKNVYAAVHFLIILFAFDHLTNIHMGLSQFIVTSSVLFVVFSLTCIGIVLEDRILGIYMELLRSVIIIWFNYYFKLSNLFMGKVITITFSVSILLLSIHLVYKFIFPDSKSRSERKNSKKVK